MKTMITPNEALRRFNLAFHCPDVGLDEVMKYIQTNAYNQAVYDCISSAKGMRLRKRKSNIDHNRALSLTISQLEDLLN